VQRDASGGEAERGPGPHAEPVETAARLRIGGETTCSAPMSGYAARVPRDPHAKNNRRTIRFVPSGRKTPPIRSLGQHVSLLEDVYHKVLAMPWWRFFAYVTAGWLGTNFVFAVLYAVQPGSVANAVDFEDAFYFSVQTLATIGYGAMSPATRYGHLVVVLEALIGTLGVALVVGVTFAKFARPTARVLFSEKLVVTVRDGVPHLVFRLANWRGNMVVEGQLRVFVLLMETTREGDVIRMPRELPLVRDRTALFALTWVPMHRIDEQSFFWGGEAALAKLREQRAEIYLAFTGIDETIGQPIHARHMYKLEDIVWNARHVDVLTIGADGTRTIDYSMFHDVEVLAEPSALPWVRAFPKNLA
jgi:inward rectifier potassium channel